MTEGYKRSAPESEKQYKIPDLLKVTSEKGGKKHTSSAGSRARGFSEIDSLEKIFNLPLRAFINSTNAGILITDDQDKLQWTNESALKHPFARPDYNLLLGKPALYAMNYLKEYAQSPDEYAHQVKKLLEKRQPHFGLAIWLKDDSLLTMDYIPIFNDKERFLGAIWQFTLAPEQQEEEDPGRESRSEESFFHTLSNFNISYCEVNGKGHIERFSPFFCKLTGMPREELMQTNFLDMCLAGKGRMMANLKNHYSGVISKNAHSFELELQVRDGIKWLQCHSFSNIGQKGQSVKCMLFMTEITGQKRIQKELEIAKKTVEEAQLAQQQFLASMSHDIRTPLNSIIGMTLLLTETPLNTEQEEYVKVLKNASNILLDLLNGILDFAKIESGKQKINQKEFDLPNLLRSLVDTFSLKFSGKPVKLICEIDPKINHFILGDSVLLNQILMNLLTNAEKFTSRGEIRLIAKIIDAYEDIVWIEFRVEDTGIGISKEKVEEIFDDFIQADEDTQINYGGSGLGLFICKRLAEMMGGEVTVTSTVGEGTTFKFSLPFNSTDKPIEEIKSHAAANHLSVDKNARILVVEDNQMNLNYLSILLKKNNIPYDIARDGKEALGYTKDEYYNLILMDMKLPKMGGMKVASEIRKSTNLNSATPIVLVSASVGEKIEERAQKAGINDLLPKPYTPDQLLKILGKYLNDDESEEDMNEKEEKAFVFNKKLDTTYLEKLYSGNVDYALSLFDIFLECTEGDWVEIKQATKSKEWGRLKDLVHKIKPNFSMVGLTWITDLAQKAYEQLKDGMQDKAVETLQEMQQEMDQYMPLIRVEHQRMKQYQAGNRGTTPL